MFTVKVSNSAYCSRRTAMFLLAVAALIFCAPLYASSKKDKNASSGKTSAPMWLTATELVYNQALYFSYVGSGVDRNAAELNALSGIAASFGQSVSASSVATESMRESDGSVSSYDLNRQVEQSIQSDLSHENLLGVDVREFWFDGKKTWYAVAVMDRAETARMYEARVVANNDEIKRLTQNSEYTFASFSRYGTAIELAKESDLYISRVMVLNTDLGRKLRNECISGATLTNERREIASHISVTVNVSGDEDGSLASAISSVLTKCGFVSGNITRAGVAVSEKYEISCEAIFDCSYNSAGTICYCRYSLIGFLSDKSTGEQLLPIDLRGREGAGEEVEARRRALTSLRKIIAASFASSFEEFLQGNY